MPKQALTKPIDIKISTVMAVCAILHSAKPDAWQTGLQQMTGGVADFFDYEFTVIDLGALEMAAQSALDWPSLITLLQSVRLNPVAVRNAKPELEAAITALGLSLDTEVRSRAETVTPAAAATPTATPQPTPHATASASVAAAATMIIDAPVRAGQRIYSHGDLIVTAAVNNGAEIIADGSIHVYAPLRGRALAGASGNTSARIFALDMEPELVSIAGVYRTFEDGFPAPLVHRPAQIRLQGDQLELTSVSLGSKT